MKNILTLIICLAACATQGQATNPVYLKWKIGVKEQLKYMTAMDEIDSPELNVDLGRLFDQTGDSLKIRTGITESIFRQLRKAFQDKQYETTLSSSTGDIVDILVTLKPQSSVQTEKEDSTEDIADNLMNMAQTMNGGVMLRGSVYANGGIHSFWVKGDQKNLIALLFELPGKPVKTGDKWSLDVSLISMDQNFKCDSSYRKNEVTLVELRQTQDGQVAVLSYDIEEFAKGEFGGPMVSKGKAATMMNISYRGLAEFSLDRGRWITYDGIMSINFTGLLSAKGKTRFSLVQKP